MAPCPGKPGLQLWQPLSWLVSCWRHDVSSSNPFSNTANDRQVSPLGIMGFT